MSDHDYQLLALLLAAYVAIVGITPVLAEYIKARRRARRTQRRWTVSAHYDQAGKRQVTYGRDGGDL